MLKGAVGDRSAGVVFHRVVKGSVRDVSSLVVCHFFQEGAVASDGTVVCHCSIEGTVRDRSSIVVCHGSIKDAVASDGTVVCHCSIEGAARDRSSVVVCHGSIKDAAGNFRTRLNLNLTRHSWSGLRSLGLALGMGGTEIKHSTSTHQIQCACRVRRVSFTVRPAGATARDFALVGSLRPAVLHHEVGAGDCSVQHHGLARHGEFHGVFVAVVAALAVAIADGLAVQAENVGIGGDDYFLVLGPFGHDDVGFPLRRHIVDFRDLGIGVGRIQSNGVGICCRFLSRLAVEHAAIDSSVVGACHTALEGSAGDHSVVV